MAKKVTKIVRKAARKEVRKTYGAEVKAKELFSAPWPGIYTHAAHLLTIGQTKYACNAIREAAEKIFPEMADKRGFSAWVDQHVRQFAIAFNTHPWWERSAGPQNRAKRVNALFYMSKLCIPSVAYK